MPLPALFSIPQDRYGFDSFVFWNFMDHAEIQLAIRTQLHINLPIYPMAAVTMNRIDRWVDLNAQAHIDMMSALGLASRDLEQPDLEDLGKFRTWLYDHAQEHLAARSALQI